MKIWKIFYSYFIPIPVTFVLLVILGCLLVLYYPRYVIQQEAIQAHRTICQNLVEMGQIKEEDCLSPSTYYEEYIPVYFPMGTTTKNTVWQGMMGITIYINEAIGRCENNELASLLEYQLMFGTNVTFGFCGNQLTNTSYAN